MPRCWRGKGLGGASTRCAASLSRFWLATARGSPCGKAGGFRSSTTTKPGIYKLLYVAHPEGSKIHGVCVAISADGVVWEKPELDVYALPDGTRTNMVLPWERGSTQTLLTLLDRVPGPRYQAMTYQVRRAADGQPTGRGMFRGVSDDGLSWTVDDAPTLPGQGDRMHLAWDPRRQTCMLLTRHRYLSLQRQAGVCGLKRDMDLWESPDLLTWSHRGRMLWPDDDDPSDLEFYSMFPAAYGPGYLGFIEVYHTAEETLDVQLAWSDDARQWRRVAGRRSVMPLGGEGAWDSHWIMLASTPPEPMGDRLRFWYAGTCTHHGAAERHRRAFRYRDDSAGRLCVDGRRDVWWLDGVWAAGCTAGSATDAESARRDRVGFG